MHVIDARYHQYYMSPAYRTCSALYGFAIPFLGPVAMFQLVWVREQKVHVAWQAHPSLDPNDPVP